MEKRIRIKRNSNDYIWWHGGTEYLCNPAAEELFDFPRNLDKAEIVLSTETDPQAYALRLNPRPLLQESEIHYEGRWHTHTLYWALTEAIRNFMEKNNVEVIYISGEY